MLLFGEIRGVWGPWGQDVVGVGGVGGGVWCPGSGEWGRHGGGNSTPIKQHLT